MEEQLFYQACDVWLSQALFEPDRLRARAAESNLRKALTNAHGQDAALIALGEFPSLTSSQLPRLWALRQHVVRERQAARARG
jgi:hypothetical protein